ncbi:MAG: ATP synthase F1 subunit gamma [Lachnospiraceae bacterium]|nr:ATP synthase F1 subunit gamma [Lachnospiraceae bacterium]
MAGGSMKGIKNRIRSMESTKQITKAMEMVASSKLRKAQARVLNSRPYFETLYSTLQQIARGTEDFSSPYLEKRQIKHSCFIVIGGDRGLAGGFNANLLKAAQSLMSGKDPYILPIGKRTVDFAKKRGYKIVAEEYAEAEDVSVGDCFTAAKTVAKGFVEGIYDEVYVVYTEFRSMLSQVPVTKKLLPLDDEMLLGQKEEETELMVRGRVLYEPSPEAVFASIIPEYLGGVIFGTLCESFASEQGARRTAMEAATDNAEEMIGNLSLLYNRARQGAITQEITEIVAGANQ